ncbi:3-oxoacyl-[acyl-carrier-protein] synthase-3 [Kitasatospora gansuensis]|uniref:3-oxoacyl-[acyl-carrier-protein] synthase-3 n=1 Tax=Kitasatospora gansuensis TaxID=258050 RepID=A0A7W7S9D1_9ACTN|nr:3-oxoacyl-ACP synthase III family protein [Kitasatospora gansuensis]MBB4946082.1 3-oxoacyl-[acyl-carrier-protein] synthase-3 [Kitasatospora gansuensis]
MTGAAPAYLASVGTALPGDPVDNTVLGKLLGVSEEWIDIFVGTRSRHFGRDLGTGEVRWSLADLCAQAAAEALESAALEAPDIEFLILSTTTPDTLLPTTASQVADRLGLDYLPVYQLQAGCSGAVQALDLGRTLIASGRRAGLVIGGDVTHRHLDFDRELARIPTDELVNYLLFGDGAGAAVLTAEPLGERVAVRGVLNSLTGLGRPAGQTVDWYGLTDRDQDRPLLREDYKAIEEQVPVMAVEIFWELLEQVGWQVEQLDHLLPPQLSERMTTRIVERLGVPGVHEVSCVGETGNTGNALPFLQLARLLPDLRTGQRALGVTVESSKWIKAGFALEKV